MISIIASLEKCAAYVYYKYKRSYSQRKIPHNHQSIHYLLCKKYFKKKVKKQVRKRVIQLQKITDSYVMIIQSFIYWLCLIKLMLFLVVIHHAINLLNDFWKSVISPLHFHSRYIWSLKHVCHKHLWSDQIYVFQEEISKPAPHSNHLSGLYSQLRYKLIGQSKLQCDIIQTTEIVLLVQTDRVKTVDTASSFTRSDSLTRNGYFRSLNLIISSFLSPTSSILPSVTPNIL